MKGFIRRLNLSLITSVLALTFLISPPSLTYAIEPILETGWETGDPSDTFGFTVSADGEMVVVGVPRSWDNGFYSGAAYVHVRDEDGNWHEPTKWVGDDPYDYFGWSVSISGETVVIGAPYDGVSGSAYVYTRNEEGNWGEPIKWVGEAPGNMFGWSVSIDGDTLVVGAPEFNGNEFKSGAAYVYFRDEGGNWGDPVRWTGEASYDGFGRSVSVDGDTVVIGAPWANSNGVDAGSAYVYRHDTHGWEEPFKWTGEGSENYFGSSVGVDGDRVVIGAPGSSSGSVYIYERGGEGWLSRFVLNGEANNDAFGSSIDVNGQTLVVGASFADKNGTQSGSVYLFDHDGCGNWRKQTELMGETAYSLLGYSVALSSDGQRLVVGAPSMYFDGPGYGYVRVYDSSMFNYFRINAGLNDAWYDPVTDGQGFFVSVFPVLCKASFAWFTYDTETPPVDAVANLGDPGHRWLTAIGSIDGNQAVMQIEFTSGGIFDTATDVQRTDPPGSDGTLTVTFDSCNSGVVEYDIPSIDRIGIVPIQRIATDNVVLCRALKDFSPD